MKYDVPFLLRLSYLSKAAVPKSAAPASTKTWLELPKKEFRIQCRKQNLQKMLSAQNQLSIKLALGSSYELENGWRSDPWQAAPSVVPAPAGPLGAAAGPASPFLHDPTAPQLGSGSMGSGGLARMRDQWKRTGLMCFNSVHQALQ